MRRERLLRVYSLMLILAFLASTITISTVSAVSDSLRVKISSDAIRELGLDNGYVVNVVTLSIPGVTVLTPDKVVVDEDSKELQIEFRDIDKYTQQINRNMMNPELRHVVPVLYINLIDYNSGISYSISISTLSLNIVEEVKKHPRMSTFNIINAAKEETLNDPYKIIEVKKIVLNKEDIKIMKKFNYIDEYNIKLINNKIKKLMDKIPELRPATATCSWDGEYPYTGTGIFQEINHTKYNMLKQDIPEWWYERYIQVDYYDDAEDDYDRLVKDLFSSVYYVDKSSYSDINDAVRTLMSYIVDQYPGDYPMNDLVGIVTMDTFVGLDQWHNTKDDPPDYGVKEIDLPIFRYVYNSRLSDDDGEKLLIDVILHLKEVQSIQSGLMFAGFQLTQSENINNTQQENRILLSAELINGSDRTVGTILIRSALLTYGEDSIIIRWITDNITCNGHDYYLLTPIATILPVYSVIYGVEDIVNETAQAITDPFEGFNKNSLIEDYYSWIEDKEKPRGHPEILIDISAHTLLVNVSVGYNSLIDIPPVLQPIVDLMLGAIGGKMGFIIGFTYSLLSSINTVKIETNALSATFDFLLRQTGSLSSDVKIETYFYNTSARYMFDGEQFYNLIKINVKYAYSSNPPPQPPCGPSACPEQNK